MPGAHANLSPSAGSRWIPCPGSVAEAAKHQGTTSEPAELGTALHTIAEQLCHGGGDPESLEGVLLSKFNPELTKFGWDQKLSPEMVTWLRVCVDYVRIRERQLGVKAQLEVRVHVGEECWGTVDVLLAVPFGPLEVCDFKFGWGFVEVQDNTQMKLYALGAMAQEAHTSVQLTVIQPKVEPPVRTWEPTMEEVDTWRSWADDAIRAALTPGAHLVPGEAQCQWCPAAAVCPALIAQVQETAMIEFDVEKEYLVDEVIRAVPEDAIRIAEILTKAPLLERLVKAAREMAFDLAVQGMPIPGFKVVRGRKNRAWKDEEKADKALGRLGLKKADRVTSKLLSPAQAEKAVKALAPDKVETFLKAYVVTPLGDPALVPESDKREAVILQGPDDQFDEIETDGSALAFLEG